jgi:hypothetical protein
MDKNFIKIDKFQGLDDYTNKNSQNPFMLIVNNTTLLQITQCIFRIFKVYYMFNIPS